jgi:hypothetical protein
MRKVSLTSSTAAARPASCTCSTTRPSASPILPATTSTSPRETSRKIPEFVCFSSITRSGGASSWGEARVLEGDAELTARLMPPGYAARPEQTVLVTVSAWDANFRQHIPQLFTAADVADLVGRIESLEAEIGRLRAAAPVPGTSCIDGTLAVTSLKPTEPPRRSS